MFSGDKKQKRERVLALDLLRGTFLIVIFINHIAWSPTLFDVLTGQSHLFASAAEGFFAISGILVGYIYGYKILAQRKQTFLRLFRRAGWLYLLSIGFTALYSLITLFLPPDTVRGQFLQPDFDTFLLKTLTLQFEYGWADFLSRYAVFMAIAPFVVLLVAKKLWWFAGAISIAIWALFGHTAFNSYTAWQLVFVFGIIIGYYLPSIEKWALALPQKTKKIARASLFTTALITFIISVCLTVILPTVTGEYKFILSPSALDTFMQLINIRFDLDQSWFERDSLAVGRIVLGTIWFTSLYIIYRSYEQAIDRKTKCALLLLGTNSLFVYGLQSFILFMMDIFLKQPPETSLILKTLVAGNAVYLVYIITKHRAAIRGFRKRVLKI